jgi:phosphate uptake regulator
MANTLAAAAYGPDVGAGVVEIETDTAILRFAGLFRDPIVTHLDRGVIAVFNFRELIELWRSDNLLEQALTDSHEMLESTQEMFHESVRSLRNSESGEMRFNVYDKDIQVNKYEREVREKVLKHLAITGGANIIPGLILTSIVIDIERLGDYTKNIMDLAVEHPKRLSCGRFEDDVREVENGVTELFDKVIPVVKETDKETARRLMSEYLWITKKCDGLLSQLIKEEGESLSLGDAVSTALYVRYLKRVAAHLLNIATSVVHPFRAIGFVKDHDLD